MSPGILTEHFLLISGKKAVKLNFLTGTGWRAFVHKCSPPPDPYDFLEESRFIRTSDFFPIKCLGGRGDLVLVHEFLFPGDS